MGNLSKLCCELEKGQANNNNYNKECFTLKLIRTQFPDFRSYSRVMNTKAILVKLLPFLFADLFTLVKLKLHRGASVHDYTTQHCVRRSITDKVDMLCEVLTQWAHFHIVLGRTEEEHKHTHTQMLWHFCWLILKPGLWVPRDPITLTGILVFGVFFGGFSNILHGAC